VRPRPFEADLEASPFLGVVVGWSPETQHHVQDILSA
jgi:hypothetical protein